MGDQGRVIGRRRGARGLVPTCQGVAAAIVTLESGVIKPGAIDRRSHVGDGERLIGVSVTIVGRPPRSSTRAGTSGHCGPHGLRRGRSPKQSSGPGDTEFCTKRLGHDKAPDRVHGHFEVPKDYAGTEPSLVLAVVSRRRRAGGPNASAASSRLRARARRSSVRSRRLWARRRCSMRRLLGDALEAHVAFFGDERTGPERVGSTSGSSTGWGT